MTWPTVTFYLGSYFERPELENFRIDLGDVRVKKCKDNYCKIKLMQENYVTNNLELELDGEDWYLSAHFEIPDFKNKLNIFKKSVAKGDAKLVLGKIKLLSNKDDNNHLFEDE